VELVGIIAIQLAQELDNVGVRIGSAKGIARAIEAEHQLSGVSGGPNKGSRGSRFRLRHTGGVGSEGTLGMCGHGAFGMTELEAEAEGKDSKKLGALLLKA